MNDHLAVATGAIFYSLSFPVNLGKKMKGAKA